MYYDSLIKYLEPFFTEQEITDNGDGTFTGKGKRFRISYNEKTKCYELSVADGDDFKTVSSYLFDETQSEKDVESVAIDFADTIRQKLGITKRRNAANIELPSDEGGETVSLTGLTQKLLAFFPQYKETYKLHCSENGRFLAVEFYKENFVPAVKALLASENKKQIKKFYDAMREIFIEGDNETVTFTVAVICAAVYDDEKLKAAAISANKEGCATFSQNIENFCASLKRSKKLRNTLI